MPRQSAHGDLHLGNVASLCPTHQLPAGVGKALEFHPAAATVVEQGKDVLSLFHRQPDLLEQVLHDNALVRHLQLRDRNLAGAVAVRPDEQIRELLDGLLPRPGLVLLRAAVGHLRRGQRVLHDDAHDHVHQAKGREEQEDDEEHSHERLTVHDVPHDVVAPPVQSHHLKKREHGRRNVAEVLLVGPDLTVVRRSCAVHFVVLPDLRRHHDAAHVQDRDHYQPDPPERFHGVHQTAHQQPEFSKGRERSSQPHKAHDAKCP
mmetsp:Transcript_26646/g.62152  ORF Transcript_26646/g.62152 Transcript_26646/m.62152 type:complete len:261 (-) Transcript_26646:380-1162(-)